MGTNYFTPENSWSHLFRLTGLTADEFYTDGGLKVNIEQLTFLELKKSGYERIVFYDINNKLYCYDEESYALLTVNGERTRKEVNEIHQKTTPSARRKKGLKRGQHAHTDSSSAASIDNVKVKIEADSVENRQENHESQWMLGKESGILIKKSVSSTLHLGMRDNLFVIRQIKAYIQDAGIKTAVVINNTASFLNEFKDEAIQLITSGYQNLGSDKENILVFIDADGSIGNIYQNKLLDEINQINQINISCPNAAEIRNMLMYFKIKFDLNIKMKDLPGVALALKQALAISPNHSRLKELYMPLKNYGSEKIFDKKACFRLLNVKEPLSARVQLENLIGMDSVKEVLSDYDIKQDSDFSIYKYITASRLQLDKELPKRVEEMIHFVLTGNPGTGKTTVAQLIGQLFYEMGYLESGHVIQTGRSKLVGGHVGETAILTRQLVEEAMGGVLFIDEAYSLKRNKDTGNDFGQEAIDTLCDLMDQYKGKFIVVAAGYPREMDIFLQSNPGLESRFKKLHIEDYSSEEMMQIFKYHVKKNHGVISEELDAALSNFCENWVNLSGENWGNAREAFNLVNNMIRAWKNDPEKHSVLDEIGEEYCVLDIKHIPAELKEYLKPVAEMREEALNQLKQMTGLRNVKDKVERLRRRMILGEIMEPGHYMFTGNPGTGKTTIARCMGRILRNLGMLKRGHLIEYTASELMSEVFNDENRGDFFAVAKKAFDGVLFIDEAYQLVNDTTGRGRLVLDALLPFMENYHKDLCVIVAGYKDEMRDFIKYNPGYRDRFSDIIHFENYSGEELHEILLKLLEEKGITADNGYKENALRALTGYVGIHGEEKEFGNARYIKNEFLPACLDIRTDRVFNNEGENFSKELQKGLMAEDIPEELLKFTKNPLKKSKTTSAMEDINKLIGFQEVKTKLMDLLFLKQNALEEEDDLFDGLNLHWVLRGNPGTGKTTVAKLIAKVYKEIGLLPSDHTIKVTRTDLVAGYVGQTATQTQKCIDRAMGGVLFIDEAYTLKRDRSSGNDFGQEAIDTLLEQMSDRNGEFAVIAAGYPREMDIFLDSNPGFESRFAENFLLEDYTAEELFEIFKKKCEDQKFYLEDETCTLITELFRNMISARIKNWANGREAENLEKKMRSVWARNPVRKVDSVSGKTIRVYSKAHVPEKYKKYLPT